MKNERDIEFTASPALDSMTTGVDFTPEAGSASTGGVGTGTGTGTMGASGTTGFDTPTGMDSGTDQGSGGGRLDQAKDRAQQLVSTAQERVTETVQSRIDAQRFRAADSLSSVAESLRSTSQQFPAGGDGIARYINQAADRVEDVAHYLHDRELSEIVDEVEGFARRQPAAFLGGAFALGILGARFLKSSARGTMPRDEMRERWSTTGAMGTGSANVHSHVEMDTSRVNDPTRDAVGRPDAPGYAPPQERGEYL